MENGRAKVICVALFQPAWESAGNPGSVTTHLLLQNLCCNQKGLFNVSLSNLLSHRLLEVHSMNYEPNKYTLCLWNSSPQYPHMVTTGPNCKNIFVLQLGKWTKKYQKHRGTLDAQFKVLPNIFQRTCHLIFSKCSYHQQLLQAARPSAEGIPPSTHAARPSSSPAQHFTVLTFSFSLKSQFQCYFSSAVIKTEILCEEMACYHATRAKNIQD